MKTLVVLSLIVSGSLCAQTRVRENIKQQTILNEDGTTKVVKQTVTPTPETKRKQKN